MKFSLNRLIVTLFIVLLGSANCVSQSGLYDISTIQSIEIQFSQSNWDFQLDTSKAGSDGYILADWVKINGAQIDSVGVKYKGNSSYNSTYTKNPLHISINEYKNQSYLGVKDIKLGNGYADPSLIREVLSYTILSNYMDCPKSNFAQVYINGSYIGLYSNDETIGSKFCEEKYFSSDNTFIKCNPIVNPGPNTKSNLKHINGVDSTGYFNYYELKSNNGWNELVQLCDTVTNYSASLETAMDMDRVIWMLAFNNVLVNLDSYTGAFAQNYYLYRDNNNQFIPTIWDLNMSFGGFPFVGSGNSSLGSLTISNMQQLALSIHATDPYWPLINAVLTDATYKRKYVAHMKTILEEVFVSNLYLTVAAQYQSLIDTAVLSDANKFFTYAQFQNGLTANATVGSYQVPGIEVLMASRISYLQSTTEFQASAPTMNSIIYSPASPTVGDTIYFNVNVSNQTSVTFGYREDLTKRFVKELMYDDGLHNDGAAGDQVFGVGIVSHSPYIQYYFYAENASAGIFLPARAEHEFYMISLNVPTVNYLDVAINEIMAKNDATVVDQNGEYDDWMEMFNNTSNNINLGNTFLSNDFLNPLKWRFPVGTIIPSQSVLAIWCDGDTTQTGIHTNFKLDADSDELLLSNVNGILIDSIAFGPQSADISLFRCPDGIGNYAYTMNSTFEQKNCLTSTQELNADIDLVVYPNPTNEVLNIRSKQSINKVELYSVFGGKVFSAVTTSSNSLTMVLPDLPNGIYLLNINDSETTKRVIIQN
jgi:hypothetical protein